MNSPMITTTRSASRALVIGYGNPHRADDGAAYHIVNSLRLRLGLRELGEGETGLEELDGRSGPDSKKTDAVFLIQLVPELADLLARYDRIVFVDAHVDPALPDLHSAPIEPRSAAPLFSHHLTPAMLLALAGAFHFKAGPGGTAGTAGTAHWGHLVSVRGVDFNFHRELSEESRALVEPAVLTILDLIGTE